MPGAVGHICNRSTGGGGAKWVDCQEQRQLGYAVSTSLAWATVRDPYLHNYHQMMCWLFLCLTESLTSHPQLACGSIGNLSLVQ